MWFYFKDLIKSQYVNALSIIRPTQKEYMTTCTDPPTPTPCSRWLMLHDQNPTKAAKLSSHRLLLLWKPWEIVYSKHRSWFDILFHGNREIKTEQKQMYNGNIYF